ncbi:MAG TPA: zf-HC2 domain-containing protein [Thermoanaerobaculia bacterium]|jgi:hypothetical protein|nr:zf-HC2 domain-containing protein [Thermoanaerobaculia bacterium]
MQEYAPTTDASPPIGACPSAEELAAYIDGTLSKAEAERVTAHLADCEDCYFVYSETLRFQLEDNVVPFRKPRPKFDPSQLWRIAALLVVGVGTGTYFHLFSAPPTLKTAEVAAPIPARSEAVFGTGGLWTGPVYRGGGSEEGEEVDEPAFRMGVQLVNLQVSLRAGKTEEAQNAIAAILGILQSGVLTQDLQAKYAKLTSSLEDGRQAPGTVLAEADRLSREVRDVFPGDEASLDLGQWVEASRLTAAARTQDFFREGDTRSFLRRLLWREEVGLGDVKLDQTTRESLEEISRILDKGELQPSDYDRLSEELRQILSVHYPES